MLVDARYLTNLQKQSRDKLSFKDAGLLTGKMRRCAHRRNPDISRRRQSSTPPRTRTSPPRGYATSNHLGKEEREAAALPMSRISKGTSQPNELELAYSYYRRGASQPGSSSPTSRINSEYAAA